MAITTYMNGAIWFDDSLEECIYILDCGHQHHIMMTKDDYDMKIQTVPFPYKCNKCDLVSIGFDMKIRAWVSVIDILSAIQIDRENKLNELGI